MQFSHLHVHTQYSLLDGAADIGSLYKKAVNDNMRGIAITDHGNMFGVFKFVAEAGKYNTAENPNKIKPIVGCEFYVVESRHKKQFTKEDKDVRYHQLLLAKNPEGYKNLVKLCSLGYMEGLYGKYPRIDKELILQYHKATTGADGNATFKLELFKEYIITATKKGFVSEKLWLDATAKGKENKSSLHFFEEFIILLYGPESNKLGAELIDKPFGKITYSPAAGGTGGFEIDKDYNLSISKEVAKLSAQAKTDALNKLKNGGTPDKTDPNAEAKYKNAIALGDKSLGTKEYNKAKDSYTQALALKPNDAYATGKLKQLEAIMKPRNPLDEKYDGFITAADQALSDKKYDDAKKNYLAASKVKPGEKYPKDKLTEIDLLASKGYKDIIFKADKFFVDKNYQKARESYSEAIALKPTDSYPKSKIAEIDKMYKDAIFKADKLELLEEHERARDAYREALTYSPNEKYPKDQISTINKKLNQSENTSDYGTLIANGDNALKAKDYIKARQSYSDALKAKPADKYAKDQLAKANDFINKNPKLKKEMDDRYNADMKKGKEAFDNKDYDGAKEIYTDALSLKPEQKFPKAQLDKIEVLIKAAEKEKDEKYTSVLANADKEFTAKHYDKAKTAYNDALAIKPGEKYPKEKLVEADKLILAMKTIATNTTTASANTDEDYKTAIANGDKAFKDKDYATAKQDYEQASTLKPSEKYPKDKLTEVLKLISSAGSSSSTFDITSRMALLNMQVSQTIEEKREESEARANQQKLLQKANAKKMANLSAKYDTENPLTRLLDIVDSKSNSTNTTTEPKK